MTNPVRIRLSLNSGKSGWLTLERAGWVLKNAPEQAAIFDADKTVLGLNWVRSCVDGALADMGGGTFSLVPAAA